MSNLHAILMIGVIAGVTILLRFLPFAIFGKRKTSPYLNYLGKVLPYAIMAMLVIFCLKNMSLIQSPHGIPELISCGVVVLLYLWKRQTLLSIVGGTACYMVLVQTGVIDHLFM